MPPGQMRIPQPIVFVANGPEQYTERQPEESLLLLSQGIRLFYVGQPGQQVKRRGKAGPGKTLEPGRRFEGFCPDCEPKLAKQHL